jgi:hypothetical protein
MLCGFFIVEENHVYKMKFTCSDFENWLMIILIDCHYIKVFPHFPWYYNLHTDTYVISELEYPFIGVLECKFNHDELLHVIYEHGP